MNRNQSFHLCRWITSICVFLFSANFSFADDELVRYLDKDVAAVAIFSKPDEILDCLIKCVDNSVETDSEWKTIFELATNESFGFIKHEELDRICQLLEEARSLLASTDEVGVVIHSLEAHTFSILIKSNDATRENFQLLAQQLLEQIQNAALVAETKLFVQFQNSWTVISNDDVAGAELVGRLGNQKANQKNTLQQTRKYKRIAITWPDAPVVGPEIRFYGSPTKLSALFFPQLSDDLRAAFRFDEVAALGLRIEFGNNTNEKNKSLATFDFVVPFTKPRVGFGAMVATYQPIQDLPTIPFDVVALKAEGFDPIALNTTTIQIFDSAQKPGEYLASKQKRAERYNRDFLAHEVPRADRYIAIQFLDGDRTGTVHLERVKDIKAMERYIRGYTESINENRNEEAGRKLFKEYPNEFGILIASRKGQMEARLTKEEKPGATKSVSSRAHNPTYFFNSDWSIRGDYYAVNKMVNAIYTDGNMSEPWELIDEVREQLKDGNVFRVRMMSLWQFDPARFETARIDTKFKGQVNKISQVKSEPENENGYRLAIEDQADCRAVVLTLISKRLARSFGSGLFFYSNEEDRLRVKGRLYPEIQREASPPN